MPSLFPVLLVQSPIWHLLTITAFYPAVSNILYAPHFLKRPRHYPVAAMILHAGSISINKDNLLRIAITIICDKCSRHCAVNKISDDINKLKLLYEKFSGWWTLKQRHVLSIVDVINFNERRIIIVNKRPFNWSWLIYHGREYISYVLYTVTCSNQPLALLQRVSQRL